MARTNLVEKLSDTVLQKFDTNLKGNLVEHKSSLNDTFKIKAKRPRFTTEAISIRGDMSNEFGYGVIPNYLETSQCPTAAGNSTGNFKLRIKEIPLTLDYFYSFPAYMSGLNNYFSVRFDSQAFAEMKNQKSQIQANGIRNKYDSIAGIRRDQSRQLEALQILKNLKMKGTDSDAINYAVPSKPVYGDFADTVGQFIPDSLKTAGQNSREQFQSVRDNYKTIHKEKTISDSLIAVKKLKIDSLDRMLKSLEKQINFFEQNVPIDNHTNIDKNSFLSAIKKFEIGMCYPNYSTFMLALTALNGINSELRYKKITLNTSYGKVVSNRQPLFNNSINQQLENYQRFFEWAPTQNSRKVIAGKVTVGDQQSQFGIGMLHGIESTTVNSLENRKNFVIELNGKLVYKFLNLDLVATESRGDGNSYKTTIPFHSEISQKALECRLAGTLPFSQTKVLLKYRIIEPDFKSFGLGFLRSDIQRFEGKFEQPIFKIVKVGLSARRENDNIKKIFGSQTVLRTLTAFTRFKLFKRKLDLYLAQTDIEQQTNSPEGLKYNNHSAVSTIAISYRLKVSSWFSAHSVVLNKYSLKGNFSSNTIQTYSWDIHNRKGKYEFNILNLYNGSSFTDSLSFGKNITNTIEIGINTNGGVRLLVGVKHAKRIELNQTQFGYLFSVQYAYKLLGIELRVEKLVIGDYISSLNYSQISRFPFYGNLKFKVQIK